MRGATLCSDSSPSLREKCGVFGIRGSKSDLQYCILGLRALQHRGQEAAGVAVVDGGKLRYQHTVGLVDELQLCSALDIMRLDRCGAVGHVRYSTSGDKSETANVQPMIFEICGEEIAVAHNGNFTNAMTLRAALEKEGEAFVTTMDSEVLGVLMQRSKANDLLSKLRDALSVLEGAYSLVILAKDYIIGLRDRLAIRPLALGIIDKSYVLASESCAIDAVGATFIRDIEGGEAVILSNKVESVRLFDRCQSKHCLFEYVYFSRPDSVIDGMSVYQARKEVGRALGRRFPVPGADVVAPVPESSVAAALGFAEVCKLPFELGVVRNSYVNRTFIQPDVGRDKSLSVKHNVNRTIVNGKSVVLVDDSLVRGNTARGIISQIRNCGAREVHMRIASPPVKNCCYYGIDTPAIEDLVSSRLSTAELAGILGLNSLEFVDIDDLYESTMGEVRNSQDPQFCDACFTGEYPIVVEDLKSLEGGVPDIVPVTMSPGEVVLVNPAAIESHFNPAPLRFLDLKLLRFNSVFDAEFMRFKGAIDVERGCGVYIFCDEYAAPHVSIAVEESDFSISCILAKNLADISRTMGYVADKYLCLIVPATHVTEGHGPVYSIGLQAGGCMSWYRVFGKPNAPKDDSEVGGGIQA